MQRFKEIMLNYLKDAYKQLIVLASLIVVAFSCMAIANGVQSGFGSIRIETGVINTTLIDDESKKVNIGYKLYIPKGVDQDHKAPAVLCLHGYQNDHETNAAYAIEMARRGCVALSIDEYGHGATDAGMIERGYVNHKVKVNYGYESDGTGFEKNYVKVSGPTRYKVMMNFSNLSFFSDLYTKSYDFKTGKTIENSEQVRDSSMGGTAAYAYLASLPYVDNTSMAVTGHSMGTWAAWTVSAAYADSEIMPKATALQCGELFKTTRDSLGRLAYEREEYVLDDNGNHKIDTDGKEQTKKTLIPFNNVLLLSAKYDEFNYFRDYIKTPIKADTVKDEIRTNFLNVSEDEAEFNKTFHQDFKKGTSVRNEYIITNHRLTTHDKHAVKTVIEWFSNALNVNTKLESTDQVFMVKEVLVLIAMLCGIASAVALIMCLKPVPFFKSVFNGVPNRPEKVKTGKKWWIGALITIAISAFTYPFLTQLGHGLLPLPEVLFKMTIGNGFWTWYLFLILVMLGFTLIPWFKQKKQGTLNRDFVDLGFARDDEQHKGHFDWGLLGKSALLAFDGVLFMYLQVIICQAAFSLDYRFIWPFFEGFSWSRFGQFMLYIPMFALFFILNNSRIFAANRCANTEEEGFVGFIKCWWKYALCMAGGIILLCLIEYIPFFMQIGPGADLLFSTTFGGPFMSLLIVFLPQVLVFSVVCTYLYRKSGNAFLGALVVAMLSCWIVTGGSAMLYA